MWPFFKFKKPILVVRPSNEIEFQEVLLDSIVQKNKKDYNYKLEVPVSFFTLSILRLIVIALLVFILIRSFQLQVIDYKKYLTLSLRNQFIEQQITPIRGVIYDINMEQLVFNKPVFRLMVDKRHLAGSKLEKIEMIKEVSSIINVEPEWLLNLIEESESSIEVVANLTIPQLLAFEEQKDELLGFFVEEDFTREYVDGPIFSHLIGYMGKINQKELEAFEGYSPLDYIGKAGVEASYESVLRGKAGLRKIKRNAKGDIIEEYISKPPKPGNSLVLWLDANLQRKANEILKKRLSSLGLKKGSIVALDPKTGGILAMVSEPSFDNNNFAGGISEVEFAKLISDPDRPLFFRAIGGQYQPGSSIKPIIALAALEDKIISSDTRLFAPLELCVKNIYSGAKECFGDWKFHGWTDLRRAIAESVNPYFYIIGGGYKKNEFSDPRLPDFFEGLGVERIKHYLSLFGLGQKLGIDISGEAEGRIPDPTWKENYFQNPQDKIWYLGDTYNLSIGQGFILLTPLQLASAFSAIANGGILYKPQVVQRIIDSQKNTVTEFSPKKIREINIDSSNLKIVKEGMRDAVKYGSAVILNSLPVEAAAKTGTAQISANLNLHYNWVTVIAPYDDPQIVLTVLIEDVPGLQAVVLPVAKEILQWYFSKPEVND